MSTVPMTPTQWLAALRDEGIYVTGYRSWTTHERDDETGKAFGPVHGVVIHHTAGTNSLELVYNGISGLPGPLCHTYLGKDAQGRMISAGRANHAGTFAENAHDAVLNESSTHPYPDAAEPIDGNDHYYGVEAENLGNGTDPWPWIQYRALVKWATAICRHHGWSEDSVIGHKEGTRRKIDPKGPVIGPDGVRFDFTMNRFRTDVRSALSLPAGAWGTNQEDEVALTAEQDAILRDVQAKSVSLGAKLAVVHEDAKVAAANVADIEAKVDALVVGGVDLDALAAKVVDLQAARLQS